MKIDDKITQERVSENIEIIKSSKAYKAHQNSFEVMLSYFSESAPSSTLGPIYLLRLIVEKAEVDEEYSKNLELFLNDQKSTSSEIGHSTIFLRDTLAAQFKSQIEEYCPENIDEWHHHGHWHLIHDNSWIPLDSATGAAHRWHVLGDSLRNLLGDNEESKTLLPSVESLIEKAKTDYSYYDNLALWASGSYHGSLEKAILAFGVNSNMESACHVMQTNRCLKLLSAPRLTSKFERIHGIDPAIANDSVSKIIETARADRKYASRLDAWRRNAAWDHFIVLAKDAGIDVKDSLVKEYCCAVQNIHNYKIDLPDERSMSSSM